MSYIHFFIYDSSSIKKSFFLSKNDKNFKELKFNSFKRNNKKLFL